MFENIKVIAADIDGTITRSDHSTSKVNTEAIEKLREHGYLFGLASGRPVEDIDKKYLEWGLNKQFDFIIGWNGCQLYDDKTKKSYNYNYLKKEEIKEIIEFMDEFDATINMYKPGKFYSSKESNRAIFSAYRIKREFVLINNIEDFYDTDNGGIMFRTTVELMPKIEEKVKKYLSNKNYAGFKTQEDLMEFANKSCNKGYALKKYCELNGISLDDCIAFGDTTNDNEMLKVCYGVCMKNGSDDTKACAKQISDIECDDDGFAKFAYKYLLNK